MSGNLFLSLSILTKIPWTIISNHFYINKWKLKNAKNKIFLPEYIQLIYQILISACSRWIFFVEAIVLIQVIPIITTNDVIFLLSSLLDVIEFLGRLCLTRILTSPLSGIWCCEHCSAMTNYAVQDINKKCESPPPQLPLLRQLM